MDSAVAIERGDVGLYRMYQDGDRARLFDALGTRFENGRFVSNMSPAAPRRP